MVCDGQDVSTRFFGSQRYVDGYNHLLVAVLDGLMPAQTRPPETVILVKADDITSPLSGGHVPLISFLHSRNKWMI